MEPAFRFAAIILASGASSRMGQPKLLLPWGGDTVLGHLIQQWCDLGATQVGVVCAAGNQGIDDELDRLGFSVQNRIYNATPELGMFSSIQCAARWPHWHSALTRWAIVLGDQPHLRPETLRTLLEFAVGHPDKICQLSRQGRRRHPVLLWKTAFLRLQHATEPHFKAFLQNWTAEIAVREIDDPGLDLDLDQPSDYERALQLYAQ
ncbi:MAG: nucleotidyltransferase family protein [Verrucomicrobia bacterium]|nr:nucleotidyltransferase family protein [Verrucomicrobiota bacterium]